MEVSACQHYGVSLASALLAKPQRPRIIAEHVARPGVDWQECDKKLLILRGEDLSGANLFGVDFTLTDLRDTKLSGANLEKASLLRASLAGSKVAGARFNRVEGYRTDFSRTDAEGAMFASAELQRANFGRAKLTNVDFTKAELGRAQFHDAEITATQFAFANLSRADFRRSNFSASVNFYRAVFFLARIEGVNLSASSGLSQEQIDAACGDDNTILPSGFARPEHWPCDFQQE